MCPFCGVNQHLGSQDHLDCRLHVKYCKSGSLSLTEPRWRLCVATGIKYDGLNVRILGISLADTIMFITCSTMSGFLLDVSLSILIPDTGRRSWTSEPCLSLLWFSELDEADILYLIAKIVCLQLKLWSCHLRSLTTTLRLPSIRKRCAWTTPREVPES
jgi:hypothetical protein